MTDFCIYRFPMFFLQGETLGPPQPLRQRAPPAKMPREVEARPKPSRRVKAVVGAGRGKKCREKCREKVERHGGRRERECLSVVLTRHKTPSLTAGLFGASSTALNVSPFYWIRL